MKSATASRPPQIATCPFIRAANLWKHKLVLSTSKISIFPLKFVFLINRPSFQIILFWDLRIVLCIHTGTFFSRWGISKVRGAPYIRVQQNPTFIFSVIRSRMLPPVISDAKDKHPTFIFSVIRRRMLPSFISDANDKQPTFIFSVIRSRMLLPFISDANELW